MVRGGESKAERTRKMGIYKGSGCVYNAGGRTSGHHRCEACGLGWVEESE